VACSVEQYVNSFLERASHQTADFLSVDAVTRDGHEVTFGGHNIAEQGQMAVVDVGAVERDYIVHFFLDGFASGFDSERLQHFDHIVRVRSNWIDMFGAQNLHERCSVRFEHPLGRGFELAVLVHVDAFLVFFDRLRHVDFGYGLDALQSHIG
jgi:hypothetical protein